VIATGGVDGHFTRFVAAGTVLGLLLTLGTQVGYAASASGGRAALAAPLPGNAAGNPLASVGPLACPSADSCIGVGAYTDTAGVRRAFIDTFANGAWSAMEAQLPSNASTSGPFPQLNSLACPRTGSCVAVGSYGDTGRKSHGLIETLAAGTWSAMEAPAPSNAGSDPAGPTLRSLACTGVGSCVAVGFYVDLSGSPEGLIDTLANGTWSAGEAPIPSGAGTTPNLELNAIACPGAGTCVAVGVYQDSSSGMESLFETMASGTWIATRAPLPSNASSVSPGGHLDQVACGATGSCAALGGYSDASLTPSGVIETLANGTWSAIEAPLPGNASGESSQLNAVGCHGAGSCVAVGEYNDKSGKVQSRIDTLANGTWTAMEAPLPSNGSASSQPALFAVTCPGSGSCVAVGDYYAATTGRSAGFIEILANATWTATEAPAPASATFVRLAAIGCAGGVGSCLFAGSYSDTTGNGLGLIVTVAEVTLKPGAAPPGGTVRAILTGFFASQTVSLRWSTPSGTVLGTAKTNSSGSVAVSFTVPSAAPGKYTVYGVGATGPVAHATLTVT
jgi:hypothetical protein